MNPAKMSVIDIMLTRLNRAIIASYSQDDMNRTGFVGGFNS